MNLSWKNAFLSLLPWLYLPFVYVIHLPLFQVIYYCHCFVHLLYLLTYQFLTMATVSSGPCALQTVNPAVLYAVMLRPFVSPLKSAHHIISRQHPMTSREADFEDCFNVFAF